MPKEVISGSDVPFGTREEPGPGRSVVEVRWDRESGYFQIVTRCVDAMTGDHLVAPKAPSEVAEQVDNVIRTLAGPEANDDIRRDAAEVMRGWLTDGIHYTDGFYVGLDRGGINALIRVLRRARDQAFGKDE